MFGDILPTLSVSSEHLLRPNQGNGLGLRANDRRDVDYRILPARIFAAAFSTGKILSFTPGGVASFKPLFSISLCQQLRRLQPMRETFSFPAQRLATDRGSNVHRYGILQLS